MLRRLIFAIPMMLILLPAQAAIASQSADTESLLARLSMQAQDIQTIQSDFVQKKRLAIFNEVLVSKGRFAFQRPGNLLWEYLEPSRSGFILRGKQGWQWDAATGRTKAFSTASSPEMEAVTGQIVAWTTFDLKWLRSRYNIEVASANPLVLRLSPTGQGVKKFLDHMLVQFKSDTRAIHSIELYEADGDWTRITFTAPRLNETLEDKRFEAP